MSKKIVCIDYDGVIHSYERGWQNGVIYGDVVPGFFEWCMEAQKHFQLVVYSSRSSTPVGLSAMILWIDKKFEDWNSKQVVKSKLHLTYAHEKPMAFVTIDDRAIQFKGDWNAPELSTDAINTFKTWNAK